MNIPKYRTGGKLYTRYQLVDLLIEQWGNHGIGLNDANALIRENNLKPVDYIPMPEMAPVDDWMEDGERHRTVTAYEQSRSNSKPYRALYDIDGLEVYIPSFYFPSEGDDEAVYAAKVQKIESL